MNTFYALVNIPKAQQKGSKNHSSIGSTMHKPMECPLYETESAVTAAIANGTFKGNSIEAYKLAKEWQAYLKTLEPKKFFPKKATANRNGKYNHVMFR